MESNICVFHSEEVRTMAFHGSIKLERWNRILNPVDVMTRIAVSRAIGEGFFSYDFTWRMNSDIIGSFISCMARTRINKWVMIKLCLNIFDST